MNIAISTLLSLLFYLWTIFMLPKYILRLGLHKVYSQTEFKLVFPNGKRLIMIHNISSFFVFGLCLIGGIFISIYVFKSLYAEWIGMWLVVAGWNVFNGVFELLTNVSPKYGILIKRHQSQRYILGKNVYLIGSLRLILSATIVFIAYTIVLFM